MAIQDLTASLDLKQNLNIYATCKQFDSLNLILSIYDNSVQADLTNYNVRLKAMKADQVPLIQEHVGITINSNIVNIEADEQLTTTAGKTLIELQFIDNTTGKKKATFNLVLVVVPSTVSIDASISTATYTLLEELENKLDQATDYFESVEAFQQAHPDLINLDNRMNAAEDTLLENTENISGLLVKTNSLVPMGHIFGGQLAKLKESLSNPLEQYIGIVFVGDSITWGRTLAQNSTTEPRDGTLSDPRDIFSSPSFVNEFKRYIGAAYTGGSSPTLSNWSASPSGESIAEYTKRHVVYPKDGAFSLATTGTSASSSEVATSASISGYQWRLSVASTGTGVHELAFNFTGNEFTLSFASTANNNLDYELFVDGISKGVFSTTPNGTNILVGNNNQRKHTFSYVRNKQIKIVTKQTAEVGLNYLRIEGLIIDKKIKISNQGINGATSKSYKTYNLTGNTYGDGEAIGAQDNYVFVQLGTNDRIINTSTPKGELAFKLNLKSVIDSITPLADVILMCANPVTNESDTTYSFTMQEARNVIYQLAKENNLDMIDNYAMFREMNLDMVLADGLHPNETGHGIIARNIINSLESSSRDSTSQVSANTTDINNLKQKATSLFSGDYTTVVGGVITLSSNITEQNKIFIGCGAGLTKTATKVITCSDAYPSKYILNEVITVVITNSSFVPVSLSFQITSANQLTVLDGAGVRIRNIKGII